MSSGAPLRNTISPSNAADFAPLQSARYVALQVQIDATEVEVQLNAVRQCLTLVRH